MKSVTVEYQRFGDKVGVLTPKKQYLRTVGSGGPVVEVTFKVPQQKLAVAMKKFDYQLFQVADEDKVRAAAENALSQLEPVIGEFLPSERLEEDDGLYQLEVVTRAFELAQLPFEVLEQSNHDVVVTRRIRQPWPRPAVVRNSNPKVLFAWAAPKYDPDSSQRMKVPNERHLGLLEELLRDWGGSAEGSLVELEHATRAGLAKVLENNRDFTHIHLLAHGIGPPIGADDLTADFELDSEIEPTTFLALEGEDGSIDRCPPKTLAELFPADVSRPASFAIATCQSGEVKAIEEGGTLAHALHETGIPVVLASQFALTQAGSDQLIKTFLSGVIDGDDPRDALRECRNELRRTTEETYYDRVALVGYIHLEEGFESQLPQKKFEVALARLKAASKVADARTLRLLEQDGGIEGVGDLGEIAGRFASVRERLAGMPLAGLTKVQREELHGLQASSLKREAEAAWRLAEALSGAEKESWLARSREALGEATQAYARAAKTSRDHHWTWVQWLALEAIVKGDLSDHGDDWIVARVAAQDHADRTADSDFDEDEGRGIKEEAIWGRGSLAELYLLSPLTGRERGRALENARTCLQELVERCRALGDEFPIESTLRQLGRYSTWWGADDHWRLPAEVVQDAQSLHDHLEKLKEDK